eukprot:TRINITY_DN6282_c0_g1_i3.p1 TRINITY_DN6282_c0_g1~~TRINITY_DN6282_c0_g1_i3.p1  ORF type:complete len:163 (-),score=48.94 TRINITY_DN6282_c0_g1_i3:278-766(-)
MIRRPPRSTLSSSSAASDVYKRQVRGNHQRVEMGCPTSSDDAPVDEDEMPDAVRQFEGLSPGEIQAYCGEFKSIDKDGNGKIDRLEARRYLQEQEADGMGAVHNLFSDGDNSRKAQFWAKYDANGDGFVTFREFLACRLAIARYSSEELARTERAMQQYDDR